MMNILLIYPEFPVTFWSFKYALPFISKKAAYPPLGLLTVASMLPEKWNRRVVDVNVDNVTEDDFHWADMVFISAMTIQRKSTKEIIARCKKAGVPVVAGGPLFNNEPEQYQDVEHLVLDEAELTLPRFLEDLAKGKAEKIYRADGFCDLSATPAPSWHLVDIKKYASMCIQFSRGCPFNCEFCNVTALFGNRCRTKTPEQIIDELNGIYGLGWRENIFFVDDNFIGNKRYLKKYLLPRLIEWRRGKKGCVFYTEASINIADDEVLMDMMVKSGFDSVFIGIESPDEESLSECGKYHNKNRDLLQNIRHIQHAGLQVFGGFIVGFDSDTESIFKRQIKFIQNSGIVTAMVGILQAPPGTKLFDRLKRENRLMGEISGDNVDGSTNIIPKMGLQRLSEGYRSIMEHIYSPKHFYRRVKVFLKEYKPRAPQLALNHQRILAFFKSGFILGFWEKERFQYWRLMLWTVLHRPRLLPLAVTLAIYGYHFRRTCELHIS